ncbi:hypothetical protein [Fischerella sp. PCC 9605]|uniref:hypothetical protein n=1 Tax=Fischerella sp. PCC 9605 TaxID=1173024 RepID=UPI00047DFA91|nr:hypothetical protein [Fischerella sp. PCC 9605]
MKANLESIAKFFTPVGRILWILLQASVQAFFWIFCFGFDSYGNYDVDLIIIQIIYMLFVILCVSSVVQKYRGTSNEKLASDITQYLLNKAPQEWEEYQDWLHDILLDRERMLTDEIPQWRIKAITHWRLIAFCVTIISIKLKKMAISSLKIRN